MSEPVAGGVVDFDDPQEVRNATANTAISAIVPAHLTILSRLPPSLLPSAKRLEYIAHRLDNEVGSEYELARRAGQSAKERIIDPGLPSVG